MAELYNFHRFESNAERLEFIVSLLPDNKYIIPVAERVKGGIRGPNHTQRELKSGNELPSSTFLPGGSNRVVIYIKLYHQVNHHGKYAE